MKELPMRNWHYGLYAIVATAIAVLGALWLGVPVGTIALLGLVLVCPLMMMFMMRGMRGGGSDEHDHDVGERYDPHRHTPRG
ncbi:DUF2933 domain-containing protein [Saccharopolyspora sp. NPDC049426]|uniref:DUF2933 domain-containing protein n=1 Tax=Saccharopolyspora sp. NPDC049426 TaxID=3155652 RepID=UPI00342B76F8